MPRVKTGTKRAKKHRKIIKATKGYKLTRSKLFKRSNQAFLRAGKHAFAGRRIRRRDMRSLWIQRIGAGLDEYGLKYSAFISALKQKNIILDRKILAELVTNHSAIFKHIVKTVNVTKDVAKPAKD
jgi:large subunit ribosomal protein L20